MAMQKSPSGLKYARIKVKRIFHYVYPAQLSRLYPNILDNQTFFSTASVLPLSYDNRLLVSNTTLVGASLIP